jgi:hypothetical protein
MKLREDGMCLLPKSWESACLLTGPSSRTHFEGLRHTLFRLDNVRSIRKSGKGTSTTISVS